MTPNAMHAAKHCNVTQPNCQRKSASEPVRLEFLAQLKIATSPALLENENSPLTFICIAPPTVNPEYRRPRQFAIPFSLMSNPLGLSWSKSCPRAGSPFDRLRANG